MSRAVFVVSLVLMSVSPSLAGAQDRAAGSGSAPATPARVSDLLREMEVSASRVQRVLADMRRGTVTERTNCVDTTLSEITATLRLALERSERATRMAQRGDREASDRERALIVRLADRVRTLERRARRCVDPDAFGPNRTRVITTIEPEVPTDAIEEPRRTGSHAEAFTRD